MRRRLRVISVPLVCGLAMSVFCSSGVTASAQAAEAATAWQIIQTNKPTNLTPGSVGKYEVFVTNVGGEKATGGATLIDELPEGLSASKAPEFSYGPAFTSVLGNPNNEEGPCDLQTSRRFTCTISKPIYAGTSFLVTIPLAVGSSPPVVTNEVLVEGGGAVGTSEVNTTISASQAPFSLLDSPALFAGAFGDVGSVPAAGSHPFVEKFNLGVTTATTERTPTLGVPSQELRNIALELPQGLVANPTATKVRCRMQILNAGAVEPQRTCPQASQIGMAYTTTPVNGHLVSSLYNMVPPPGVPAALGFEVAGVPVEIVGGLGGNFHLTAKSTDLVKYANFRVTEFGVVLWGVPYDSRHDIQRNGGEAGDPAGCFETNGCAINEPAKPFLTMPTSCTEPLTATATLKSWLGSEATGSVPFTDREFSPAQLTGCNQLAFEPTIESQASTNAAETPSGLDFSIHQPQDESPYGRATAALKDATVTLPEGMTLNPSAANGLSSCTEQQMGYAPEGGKIRFATTPQSCPDAAKVGSLEVTTPLLETKLPGSIYLAKPFDNPFGSMVALYLAIEDEQTGTVVKLAGKVEPDPATGRLTARFTENPELPVNDLDLHFFNGARGALTTPLTCGTKTTTSTLTPWSTPEGADAHPTGSFETTVGCQSSEAAAPKTVSFSAGSEAPLSGAYSPFSLHIARPDGTQHITGIDTTLPQGLIGKLAGVAYCPEGGIAQAISREAPEKGKQEQASPSCPSSSEIGTVQVTAGSGIAPVPVSGHAYLAGPYKGAPLSMVVIVPAVTGPFDLGTVVNRVSLNIGEYDARIHAVSDPLPTIREGIPLDVRSIDLKLDRPDFTLNPTSCEAAAIEGSVSTQAGQSAPLKNRFQVGECNRLKFKPKVSLSLKGGTKRSSHPALKAVVSFPRGGEYANIASAQVSLPHSEFLDQSNIGTVCTQAQLKSNSCPPASVYGKVKLWTPLFAEPLQGNVYLGVGFGHKLPDLVAELNGQVRVLLHGKVDTDKQDGIRNTFEAVPDAPAEKFVLEMKGGPKYGLLVNSENICKKTQKAEVSLTAANGKALSLSPKIANSCKGKAKKKKHGHKKNAGH